MKNYKYLIIATSLLIILMIGIVQVTGTNVSAKDEDFRVENGVLTAYVGSDTFVSVPENVTVIGEKAFSGNTTMTRLELPYGLETIEFMAFSDCTALIDVTIPDTVTRVEPGAFMNCTALSTFEIGKNVSSWGSGVLNGCTALSELILDSENQYLTFYNGALYNGDMSMLYQVLPGRDGENYVMPEETEDIDAYALWGLQNVTNIMTSDSVITITENAFASTGSVQNIVLTDSVKTIEEGAFTDNTSLTQVYIPASVVNIEDNAFSGNTNLQIYTSEGSTADQYGKENNIPVIYESDVAIDFNDSNPGNVLKPSTDITVSKEIPLSEYRVLRQLENGEYVYEDIEPETDEETQETEEESYVYPLDVIEEGVSGKTIIVNGQAVFLMNNKEEEVMSGEDTDEIVASDSSESEDATSESTESEEAESEATESENTESENTESESESDVESTADQSETEQTTQSSTSSSTESEEDDTKIPERAYYKQNNLTNYEIDEKIEVIGRLAFARTNLKSIDIPEGVTTIEYGAFYECNDLAEVTIPSTVTDIGNKAFGDTAWLDAWLDGEDIKNGDSVQTGDFLIVGDGILLAYRGDDASVQVPEGVKQIGPECFYGHTEITEVYLPDSTVKVCGSAFAGCENLVNLTGCKNLKTVVSEAFRGTQITQEGWQ